MTHEPLSIWSECVVPALVWLLSFLERTALASTNRGVISILDLKGLKRAANGAYGVSEAEYERVSINWVAPT